MTKNATEFVAPLTFQTLTGNPVYVDTFQLTGEWEIGHISLADRAALERAWEQCEKKFADEDVPRPPHWGGYRVIPSRMEFWQGRENRLHDRLLYSRAKDAWKIERLAP